MRASEANHLDINLAAFRPLHLLSSLVRVRAGNVFSRFRGRCYAAALRDLPATGGIAVYSVFPSVRYVHLGLLDSILSAHPAFFTKSAQTPCKGQACSRRLNFIPMGGRQIL